MHENLAFHRVSPAFRQNSLENDCLNRTQTTPKLKAVRHTSSIRPVGASVIWWGPHLHSHERGINHGGTKDTEAAKRVKDSIHRGLQEGTFARKTRLIANR